MSTIKITDPLQSTKIYYNKYKNEEKLKEYSQNIALKLTDELTNLKSQNENLIRKINKDKAVNRIKDPLQFTKIYYNKYKIEKTKKIKAMNLSIELDKELSKLKSQIRDIVKKLDKITLSSKEEKN